ncbi:MAG: hypothetical protein PUP46_08360 [Endozoicomonas sp. (ex Botrylloides leachii)]|nr:hypothetical protein [Endozoicomonas sp. (ex Botrylloides leachii)]
MSGLFLAKKFKFSVFIYFICSMLLTASINASVFQCPDCNNDLETASLSCTECSYIYDLEEKIKLLNQALYKIKETEKILHLPPQQDQLPRSDRLSVLLDVKDELPPSAYFSVFLDVKDKPKTIKNIREQITLLKKFHQRNVDTIERYCQEKQIPIGHNLANHVSILVEQILTSIVKYSSNENPHQNTRILFPYSTLNGLILFATNHYYNQARETKNKNIDDWLSFVVALFLTIIGAHNDLRQPFKDNIDSTSFANVKTFLANLRSSLSYSASSLSLSDLPFEPTYTLRPKTRDLPEMIKVVKSNNDDRYTLLFSSGYILEDLSDQQVFQLLSVFEPYYLGVKDMLKTLMATTGLVLAGYTLWRAVSH